MRIGHIYSIADNNNNVIYIGSTVNLAWREYTHELHSRQSTSPFHVFLRENKIIPKLEVIESIHFLDIKCLRELEKYWIEQFRQWGFSLQNVANNASWTKKPIRKAVDDNSLFYRPSEVAAILNISKSRVYYLGVIGVIKKIQIGRTIRYRVSDIQKLI